MSKPVYTLNVTFKSNERPFSTNYDPRPYGPKTDEEAVEWARGMQEGLGGMYTTTLFKDGVVMEVPEEVQS